MNDAPEHPQKQSISKARQILDLLDTPLRVRITVAILLGIIGFLVLRVFPWRWIQLPLCLASIAVILGCHLSDRFSAKKMQVVMTVLLAALTIAVVSRNLPRQPLKRLHSWNLFHYVLGTKYFDELGYFDLYKAVLLADEEGQGVFSHILFTRDMHTYEKVLIKHALTEAKADGLRDQFTTVRWDEFKQDLGAILKLRSDKKEWVGPIADRGFNPSPAWLSFHRPLLNLVDVHKYSTLRIFAVVQIPLYIIAFATFGWAFGLRPTLCALLWLNLYFGCQNRLLGGYFSYDWLCFILIFAALYKKGRPISSGALLAYPTMVRGFPGLLALHAALNWATSLARRKWPQRSYTTFIVILVCACLILVVLSSVNRQGLSAWRSWKEKITIHAKHHTVSYNRIGLKYLFAHAYLRDKGSRVSESIREKLVQQRMHAYDAARIALLLFTILAMLRRSAHEGMLLSIAAIFFCLMLSRYYLSIVLLLFTWEDFDRKNLLNLVSGFWLFALLAFHYWFVGQPTFSWYHTYYYFNLGLFIYFVAIVAYFLANDAVWLIKRQREIHG